MLRGSRPLSEMAVAQPLLLLLTLLPAIAIVSVVAEMTSDYQMRQATVSSAKSPLLNEGATDFAKMVASGMARSSQVREHLRKSQQGEPSSESSSDAPHINLHGKEGRSGPKSAKTRFEEAGSSALYASESLHGTSTTFTNMSNSSLANRRRRTGVHYRRLRRQTFPGWMAENTADPRNLPHASEGFDTPWTMIGESFYKVTPPASWTDAQQTCLLMSASLAVINSQSDENATRDFLNMLGRTRVWIGLNDRQTEGQWVWDSGHRLSYTNWIGQQPNNYKGREDCVEFHAHNPTGFNDNKCSELYPALCMRTGGRCGDTIIGSGIIRYPTFSANYAGNRSCTWTVQATPGAAGISLQIGHVSMDACCDYLRISNIFGVQLAVTGVQQPKNITLDSPAIITFDTNSSVAGKSFTITFHSTQSYAELCDPGWTMKRGSCYKVTPAMSWVEARQACADDMNGFLADIGSEVQESDIYEFLDTQEIARAWIGLDRESEGQWKWNSGRAVTYLNWNQGQPDGALIGEDCVELNAQYRTGFSNTHCTTRLPGLCKRIGRMCNGVISGSGVIRSPGFPTSYLSNLDCMWTIQAEPGYSEILLQVMVMSTETYCDHVHISNAFGFQISLSGVQEPQNITLRSPATVSFTTDYSGESEGFAIVVSSIPNHTATESTTGTLIAVTAATSTIVPSCVILILLFICWKRKIAFFKVARSYATSQSQHLTSGVHGGDFLLRDDISADQSQGSGARYFRAQMADEDTAIYDRPLSQQADRYDAVSCIYEPLGVDLTDHTYQGPDGVPSYFMAEPSTKAS